MILGKFEAEKAREVGTRGEEEGACSRRNAQRAGSELWGELTAFQAFRAYCSHGK